jgi:hypothetical protein
MARLAGIDLPAFADQGTDPGSARHILFGADGRSEAYGGYVTSIKPLPDDKGSTNCPMVRRARSCGFLSC